LLSFSFFDESKAKYKKNTKHLLSSSGLEGGDAGEDDATMGDHGEVHTNGKSSNHVNNNNSNINTTENTTKRKKQKMINSTNNNYINNNNNNTNNVDNNNTNNNHTSNNDTLELTHKIRSKTKNRRKTLQRTTVQDTSLLKTIARNPDFNLESALKVCRNKEIHTKVESPIPNKKGTTKYNSTGLAFRVP
jgi:hypothetical protein